MTNNQNENGNIKIDVRFENWKSQIVTSNSDKMGLRKIPFVFIEHGISIFKVVKFEHFKNLSTLKAYLKYTSLNTPFPPLNNVPKKGSSL